MEIPIDEPEKINYKELMEYYKYNGKLGLFKLKIKLAKNYLLQIIAEFCPISELSVKLHRLKGVNIGNHVCIGPKTFIDILYPHLITIEDYVSIGQSTMIFAHSNPTNSYLIKAKIYPRKVQPVTIRKGAWISVGCIILEGVTIGEHSIIGANSVVHKDVPPKTMAIGTPIRMIKKLKL